MRNQLYNLARQVALRMPHIKELVNGRRVLLAERNDVMAERDRLENEVRQLSSSLEFTTEENRHLKDEVRRGHERLSLFGESCPFVPNGHFYSPIPSQEELLRDSHRIFSSSRNSVPDIDLREEQQLALLEKFALMYRDLPFSDEKKEGLRYYFDNPAYGYSDAIFLNSMIRYARPKRIVEIGSGFSSCMTLDTNEIWFGDSINCTFIEPYPDLLYSLLKLGDLDRIRVIASRIQDADLSPIADLESGDILFIDSTHVSKIGSDVNRIVFDVLPSLRSGVYIHFHDIFYPFEYPKEWAIEGRAWNEAYILRAFLQNNSEFEIVAFNTFLEEFHRDFFVENMPLCLKNTGASIWLCKR
ncbi:class I SAM-dependent methyltransferase [Paraburkholderia madseniana]|uniref:class I SAM-dependent methyltransferase n=1 Tax=Paraburkholderia madseniana TaxID=2599607 RepID=UPI0038BABCD3